MPESATPQLFFNDAPCGGLEKDHPVATLDSLIQEDPTTSHIALIAFRDNEALPEEFKKVTEVISQVTSLEYGPLIDFDDRTEDHIAQDKDCREAVATLRSKRNPEDSDRRKVFLARLVCYTGILADTEASTQYTVGMSFEDYKTKQSVVIVYTGESKGKTSASLGLLVRALGNRWNVAFIQFIKYWGVGEHVFIRDIMPLFRDQLLFYKGGKGFYKAGDLSATEITEAQHKQAALETYHEAYRAATSGDYDLVICDEINNAVHDGLLTTTQLKALIKERSKQTSLCLTGRNFPKELLPLVDIATDMTKIKHHFDDKYVANKGIDY